MTSIFKDIDLKEKFEENGFLIIPFLNKEEVQELKDFYNSLTEEGHKNEYGFHLTLDNPNQDFVKGVIRKIRKALNPALSNLFQDFQVIGESFLVKEPGAANFIPPHQDWTFVDEQKYYSIKVWVPLENVALRNGGLGLIKGSHQFLSHKRGSPLPYFQSPYDQHGQLLYKYLDTPALKAGEVILFDDRLVHGSFPNLSNTPRIAVGLTLTPLEAPLFHYFLHPKTDPPVIEKYEIDKDFLLTFSNGKLTRIFLEGEKPVGLKSLGTEKYQFQQIDADELERKINSVQGNSINPKVVDLLDELGMSSLVVHDKEVNHYGKAEDKSEKEGNNQENVEIKLKAESSNGETKVETMKPQSIWGRLKALFN